MLQTILASPRIPAACPPALLPHRHPHGGEHAWLHAGRGLKSAAGGSAACTACWAAGRRRKGNAGATTKSEKSSASEDKPARDSESDSESVAEEPSPPRPMSRVEEVLALGRDGRVTRRSAPKSELDEMLSVGPEEQAGVLPPLNFWDPADFIGRVGNPKGNFINFRQKELKHGRIAMLAVVGVIGQHWVRFPMFDGTPRGIHFNATSEGKAGFVLLLIFAAAIEISVGSQNRDKRPGDFGDPWGFAEKLKGIGDYDERDWMNKELSNGRLAMIVIIITFIREAFTDLDAVDQLFYSLGLLPGVITTVAS
eukprot:TRINITY_DN25616_c0_g1_i1.p1 TRINITY_DN25616_c0_g1~~TRINITY_DN25616_c0_g1_i1.p1  ORF type:complete len:318 (+),score=52.47 TRINITY_DN25616_c0_g1_i1:26-955(+)